MPPKESLKFVAFTPYVYNPDQIPSGVNTVLRDTQKMFIDKGIVKKPEDFRIYDPLPVNFPFRKKKVSVADGHFGVAALPIPHDRTIHDYPLTLNVRGAKKIIYAEEADGFLTEELFAGFAGAVLHLSQPLRTDGKTVPMTFARYHARLDVNSWAIKLYAAMIKNLRGPRLNKLALPTIHATDKLFSALMQRTDRLVAVSEDTRDYLAKWDPDAHIDVIHNSVNTDVWTPDGPRFNWNDDGTVTVLFFGRHDKRKGLDDLLRADQKLLEAGIKNIQIKIVGEGGETKKMKAFAHRLGLPNVEWLGRLPDYQRQMAARSADIVASPAKGNEGLGVVLLEAMASGANVIGTQVGGYRIVLDHDDNPFRDIMVPPNSPESLAEKIVFLAKLPPEERTRRGIEGRKDAKNRFGQDTIANKWAHVVEETARQRGTPKPHEYRRRKYFETSGVIYKAAKRKWGRKVKGTVTKLLHPKRQSKSQGENRQ